MYREEVVRLIRMALAELKLESLVEVEVPEKPEHGQWSSPVALKLGGNPRERAEKLVAQMKRLVEHDLASYWWLEKIEVAGPGFVNVFVSDRGMVDALAQMVAAADSVVISTSAEREKGNTSQVSESAGGTKELASDQEKPAITSAIINLSQDEADNEVVKKTYVVEYSSPNIAKPFTVGHLRSTIIGDAVANLLERQGHTVHRDNHVGDWGTQFGKQIYAIKNWGDEEAIASAARPVEELVKLYVKFHQEAEQNPELDERGREWFKKLEDGDEEARRLWQQCVQWSWQEFNQLYQKLGVTFTENRGKGYGESFFEDKMGEVIEELTEKGLLQAGEDGAKLVFFPEEMELPPAMIVKRDGATLYHTRDLATDKFRLEQYGSEVVIINEVGAEQELYFRQLFAIEELLGWVKPGQRVHVKHGLYRFPDGKMSTRKGNVIWLEEVLEEAVSRAKTLQQDRELGETAEQVAEMVGIGALKWNDLKSDPKPPVVFEWDRIVAMEGNSGPYMQYSAVRAVSVVRTAMVELGEVAYESMGAGVVLEAAEKALKDVKVGEMGIELIEEERAVIAQLTRFEEVLGRAAEELAPHLLAGFLYELAQRFNGFYHKHSVAKAESEEVRWLRIGLATGVARVLREGLGILGIQVPERM